MHPDKVIPLTDVGSTGERGDHVYFTETQHFPAWIKALFPVPFLPARVRDIPLADIAGHEVRTYRVLFDREYWGRHFWGLGSALRRGAHIYVMNARPLSGRGVQLQLGSGERLLVGSKSPEALAGAIALAKTRTT